MNSTGLYVLNTVMPAALGLLPPQMDSRPARAMLVAIALQESGFRYRRQVAGYAPDGTRQKGPARGWWQFEANGGTRGVLEHSASRPSALALLDVLGYADADAATVHAALEHNDVLACAFARLLLWTDPRLLPQGADRGSDGWIQYLACWRPGKPKAPTWQQHFSDAWTATA